MGYGGLEIEYIASSDDIIHISMGLLVGGGGIGYKLEDNDVFNTSHNMNSFL